MISKYPAILGYSIERTKSIINSLETYGLSKEQIIKMISKYPSILGCSLERTKSKTNFLETYGLSKEQVIRMISVLPSILTCSLERTEEKLDFYTENNIEVIQKPNRLIQSLKKTKKRIEILEKLNCNWREKEYMIFLSQKQFDAMIAAKK